jgi:hypothetical protein
LTSSHRRQEPNRRPGFQPVETYYNGNTYDSRLDARWAVFLDTLEMGARYTPAAESESNVSLFHLPTTDAWVTVTPILPLPDDTTRAHRWVYDGVASQAAVLFGRCWFPWERDSYGAFLWFKNAVGEYGWQRDAVWRECVGCSARCLGTAAEACAGCGQRHTLALDTERLIAAYETAAGMSFVNRGRV